MKYRVWFVTCLIVALSACGFQLRGNYSLPEPLQQLQLQSSDPYSAITRQVSKRLQQGGVDLVTHQQHRGPLLILGEEKLERSNLSLYPDGPLAGQVAEYRLIYKLSASLLKPGQAPKNIKLQVQRDYLDDPSEAQAKRRELEVLLGEMRQQIAAQLIIQLAEH